MLVNSDVSVEFSDGTLGVYVVTNREESGFTDGSQTGSGLTDGEEKWILHFAAYPFGTWPSETRLYWNGCEILCDKVQISMDKNKGVQEGYLCMI